MLERVTFHVPRRLLRLLDMMVERGLFTSRSEAIRFFVMSGVARLLEADERWEAGLR